MRAHFQWPRLRAPVARSARGCLCLWMVVGGLLFGSTFVPVRAQIVVPDIQPLSPTSQIQEGVRLVEENRTEEAIALLRRLVKADSALTVPSYGSTAYWLGKAYQQAGQSEKAWSTWQAGLHALRAADKFDLRLADTYLRHLTPNQLRGERLYAVDVYRSLLARVGTDTSDAARALFRRRVAQVAPLMSDDVLGRVIEQDREADQSTWTFHADAGEALSEWWRTLDPLPSTEENERLEEHMARLVHVNQEFSCPERPSAIDDRGVVYLRFGAPYKRRPLNYKDGKFFREVFRFGVSVPPSGFPESEMWLYPHIDESGYYLFAEESSECFSIAKANDLIPRHLTMRRASTERGLNIAYSALMAMRAIYRELALYHIDFSGRYSEIANYASWQEMQAMSAEMAQRAGRSSSGGGATRSVTVSSGIGQTRQVFESPMFGISFPTDFVGRMVSRAYREDQRAAERREEAMPRQYTALFEGSAQLPVAVRTARFLNEDGSTRTEVYWGVPASGLALDAEGDPSAAGPSLITFSAVRYNGQHESRQRKWRRYQVDVTGEPSGRMIVPPSITLGNVRAPYHLGLQWEQYELWQRDSMSGGVPSLGRKRRIATFQADSLQPLRAEGPDVEMSDVKVMTLPDTSAQTLAQPMEHAQPYPFRTLSTDTPLLLGFEIYHLNYGSDDRTRYTISYEAEGETRRGWTRLFRGNDVQRTSTEMTMEGRSRQTEEAILLDLADIKRDESQNVRVTVRVTDELTGSTVSRDVTFVLEPRSSSGE